MDAASERDLQVRVERLERFALAAMVVTALVPLLIGWVLPWYDERHAGEITRVRLVSFGFFLFDPPEGHSLGRVDVLLCLGFLFLDVATVATVIMLLAVARRSWLTLWLGSCIVGLMIVCLAAVLLLTAVASGAERTEVHPAAAVLWGLGVVFSAVTYFAGTVRAWWLPRPEVSTDRRVGRMAS